MKFHLGLIAGLILVGASLGSAQTASKPATAADAAWLNVTAQTSAARTAVAAPKTADQAKVVAQQYATQQKSAAQSARDFYASFPSDPRAPQAKKLEATSLLNSAWPLPDDKGRAAFQTANAYAIDKTNSAKDRFEVSALLAAQQFKARTNGRALASDAVAAEKVADVLFAEYGPIPESFDYYLKAADTADPEASARLASKVTNSTASLAQKKQAQVVIDRYALVGKPLTISLQDIAGKSVDLRPAGKITVIYVWSAKHGGADWAALGRARQAAPANTDWICLALDTTSAELAAAVAKAPAKLTHSLLAQDQRVAVMKSLKVRRVPFVYVVEARGTLATYGSLTDLPVLLSSLNR